MPRTALLALCILTVACGRDVASTVLAHARTVPPPKEIATEVTRFAAAGKLGTVVFNRLPAKGEIAVILASPSTDWPVLARFNDEAGDIEGNCYALSASRSVVCDMSIFTDRPNALLGPAASDTQRLAFARWTIGHELGHLATKSAGFDVAPRRRPKRDDLDQQRREYAADCWMVQTFARSTTVQEQVAFESFAIDIINEHFRRTEPHRPAGVGLIFNYASLDPYRFSSRGSHPDDILRSIRLLHIAAEQRNDTTLRLLMSPLIRKLKPDPLWTNEGPCGLSRPMRAATLVAQDAPIGC